ncbi:MAG: hypothetical protein IPM34_01315 [Saprospiraceae bacterium]|nr:hypothetical protein [Saprospiraceae bacterium]
MLEKIRTSEERSAPSGCQVNSIQKKYTSSVGAKPTQARSQVNKKANLASEPEAELNLKKI